MPHTPLIIKNTFPCQPHPLHPSVVYTKEGWNGHRFWMAQTPLPPFEIKPYRDRYELPCIHFSDDGIHWSPIPNNPIEELSKEEIRQKRYYSDPHLLLHDGILEIYYRYTILVDGQLYGNKTLFCRRTSCDGYQWSEKTIIADLRNPEDNAIWGDQIISPAIVWDGSQYTCWYVDASGYEKNRHVRFTTSDDGIHWKKNDLCELIGEESIPWHIDVQHHSIGYILLCYSKEHTKLSCYISPDGKKYFYKNTILSPSEQPGNFYSHGIYRACSVAVGSQYYVYFSANTDKQGSIGLFKTPDFNTYLPINGMSQLRYWYSFKRRYAFLFIHRRTKRMLKKIKKQLKKFTSFDKCNYPIDPIDHYRALGTKIGENVSLIEPISPVIFSSEPYLVTIGDNTTVSFDSVFVTHDAATRVIRHLPDSDTETVVYGPITVGKNCFIGCRSVILPNVSIGDNSIIGAGSVVNRSIPANSVAAGNPCRVICSLNEYRTKHQEDFLYMVSLDYNDKREYLENLFKP